MKQNKEFTRIYENNVKIVYRYIYARLFNKSMVEDLTSKTFEIAYSKFIEEDMEELDNPKTWLIQIARNVMGNHIQKKKIKGAPVEEMNLPSDDDPLLDQQISQEQIDQIKHYFEGLDADTREVITLKIWEGYKFREISEITGLNESSAKTLYYRGLKKIRETMKDKEKEKREYAVVIAGLSALKSTSVFTPSNAFVQTALTKISMEAAAAAGSFMGNILNKSITLLGKTFTIKQLFVGTTVAVAGLGAVGGGAVLYNQSERNNLEQQDTDNVEEREYRKVEEYDTSDWEEKELQIEGLPDDKVIKTVTIRLPEDAEISEDSSGGTSVAVIEYESSRMTIGIPHGVVSDAQGVDSYESIENENLGKVYRVVTGGSKSKVSYVDTLKVEEACETNIPENPTVEAPCGNFTVDEIVVSCSEETGDFRFCDAVTKNFKVEDGVGKTGDEDEKTNNSTEQTTKVCKSDVLDFSLDIPADWRCDVENLAGGSVEMKIEGDVYSVIISNLGRGPACGDGSSEATDPGECELSKIYTRLDIGLELYMYESYGENLEIFGGVDMYPGNLWISAGYDGMANKDLTSKQLGTLAKVMDSISTKTYEEVVRVEAVEYSPDPANYTGFRTCDYERSTCSVYGVETYKLPINVEIGEEYMLYFMECGDGGAAAGTSYCNVIGAFSIKEL